MTCVWMNTSAIYARVKITTRCGGGRRWRRGGDDGVDGGDDDDDDLDEFQLDGGDDGVDFHLREGISPGRFLSAGELFSLWCSPPRSGGRIFL